MTGPPSSGRATLVRVTAARLRRPTAVVVAVAAAITGVGAGAGAGAATSVGVVAAAVAITGAAGAGAVAGGRRQIDQVGLVWAQHAAPLLFLRVSALAMHT